MVTEVNEFVTVAVCNANYLYKSLLQQYVYSYQSINRAVNFKMTFVSRRDVYYFCVIHTSLFNLVIFDDVTGLSNIFTNIFDNYDSAMNKTLKAKQYIEQHLSFNFLKQSLFLYTREPIL